MKVQQLFERDITRSINGVVKADQLDANSIWQELDEFVVTHELGKHLDTLVSSLVSAIEDQQDPSNSNGIWVSGFFGSGKSHLIKVLTYLLQNDEQHFGGATRRAVDFFEEKISDAILYADLKKVAAAGIETVLFNVDSKADHQDGRDALIKVFLRVFNEKRGYCGEYPHIAHLERHLDGKGKLEQFHAAFEREAGSPWLTERDGWEFQRDELIAALAETLDQSKESVERWVDGSGENFSVTVENFAKWVREYLDAKGPDSRIMFLVDEVGQFIGNDTHLMLSLQTITEQLGTVCAGRAWVVVTSQEDLEAVMGNATAVKGNDFSKIQGRFRTRLSLSSQNVDEVIKKRILDKSDAALPALQEAYAGKHDILKNQLSFTRAGGAFKTYADAADFAACYPFAAYQFYLVQRVFESIRAAGATGLHLSRGERSTLDAFQSAAKQVASEEIGVLVPFYRFYEPVEGFLDTAVKLTIDQAASNHALKPFDQTLLQLLFLIRYIDQLPGTVDNLATLCVDQIDADKLALRRTIEESLARLESETLIARSGDVYFFLTNEERDINRAIKNVSVPSGKEATTLGSLIFAEIFKDKRKHEFGKTGRSFAFNRICDEQAVGQKLDGDMEVVVITPLHDDYAAYSGDDARCVLDSSHDQGRILIRFGDNAELGREVRVHIQTDEYVRTRNTTSLPDSTRNIIRKITDENRERWKRIEAVLRTLLADANMFVCGQRRDPGKQDPRAALDSALDYLIENSYPKMDLIRIQHAEPKREIQTTLRANNIDQLNLDLKTSDSNSAALDDVRQYIRLCAQTSKQVVLSELVDKRYGGRPYGWPDMETVLLVAHLAVLREVELQIGGASLPLDQAYDHVTSPAKQRKVVIVQRESADSAVMKEARALSKELFHKATPDAEDALYQALHGEVTAWSNDLTSWQSLASTGSYPGAAEIKRGLDTLKPLTHETDSVRFLKRFNADSTALRDLADDLVDLRSFYTTQRPAWDKLRATAKDLDLNRTQLESHEVARPALARIDEILEMPSPYRCLAETADLEHKARTVNEELVSEARKPVIKTVHAYLATLQSDLDNVNASDSLRSSSLGRLNELLEKVSSMASIAHIKEAHEHAERALFQAQDSITASQTPAAPEPSGAGTAAPAAPILRLRQVISVAELHPGGMIDTKEVADAFLTKLRSAIDEALDQNKRIQIK